MKINILFAILVLPLSLIAQTREGTIVYDETIQLEIDLPDEHREQLKGILPDSRTTQKVLIFNETESIYKDLEGQESDQVVESGSESSGIHMKMIIERPDNQLYKNLEDQSVSEKQEFFGRDFLISDQIEKLQWKLTNSQKEILGFTCQQALLETDDGQVEAWYTNEIPISNGPHKYGQLPGMILELNKDGGKLSVTATSVSLEALEQGVIQLPKKGKKVNREEYDRIVRQKTQEMEDEYGKSGSKVIIKTMRE